MSVVFSLKASFSTWLILFKWHLVSRDDTAWAHDCYPLDQRHAVGAPVRYLVLP